MTGRRNRCRLRRQARRDHRHRRDRCADHQEVAKTVGHLTVFQRTPNWCAPLHNAKIGEEEMRRIRARYAEIFARCQETYGCFIHATDPRATLEVTPRSAKPSGKSSTRARFRHLAWAISATS